MALPSNTTSALKEWATVLTALERGEQTVLIRKGGLIEPGSGFEVLSETFLFYPTFEHQAVNYLRPQYQPHFEAALAHRAPEGMVTFSLLGQAVRSFSSQDPLLIERLSAHHIYNQDFQTQRLKWQPDQPLAVVIVRAFRLATPITIPVAPHYAGCKSWVNLEHPVALTEAKPVLDEITFGQRLQLLEALLKR